MEVNAAVKYMLQHCSADCSIMASNDVECDEVEKQELLLQAVLNSKRRFDAHRRSLREMLASRR